MSESEQCPVCGGFYQSFKRHLKTQVSKCNMKLLEIFSDEDLKHFEMFNRLYAKKRTRNIGKKGIRDVPELVDEPVDDSVFKEDKPDYQA